MKRVLMVLALASACDDAKDNHLTLKLDDTRSELTADNKIVYQGNGSFIVGVTATTDSDDIDTNLVNLAAELTVSLNDAANAGPTKIALVRSDAHTYGGAAMLSWPLGGQVIVSAHVAGVQQSASFELVKPDIKLVLGAPASNVATATVDVPFCVVSTARGASVVLHLEKATFMNSTDVDKTVSLIRGPCMIAAADGSSLGDFDVESHATLTLTATDATATISATFASPTMNAPPLAYIGSTSVGTFTVPSKIDSVAFTAPTPATSQVGQVVTVKVLVKDTAGKPIKGVTETFSSSAGVMFQPATAKTDDDGVAVTAFVMPDVGGGSVLIDATGAPPLAVATAP